MTKRSQNSQLLLWPQVLKLISQKDERHRWTKPQAARLTTWPLNFAPRRLWIPGDSEGSGSWEHRQPQPQHHLDRPRQLPPGMTRNTLQSDNESDFFNLFNLIMKYCWKSIPQNVHIYIIRTFNKICPWSSDYCQLDNMMVFPLVLLINASCVHLLTFSWPLILSFSAGALLGEDLPHRPGFPPDWCCWCGGCKPSIAVAVV